MTIICVGIARTMYSALTVVAICRSIATRTLLSSASRVLRNSLIRVPVSAISWTRGTQSFDSFVTTNSGVINAFVEDYRRNYGSIRVHVRVDAIFTREVEEGRQRISAYFSSAVQDIDWSKYVVDSKNWLSNNAHDIPKLKFKIGPSRIKYSLAAVFLLPVSGVVSPYYIYSLVCEMGSTWPVFIGYVVSLSINMTFSCNFLDTVSYWLYNGNI